jgi:hypothetical protein
MLIVGQSIEKKADQPSLIKHKNDITNSSELETLVTSINAVSHIDFQ